MSTSATADLPHPPPHPRLDTGAALRGESPSPSPRSASISLQAAATVNAGLQREPTRQASNGSLARSRTSSTAGRRRSLVLMNVHANDPSVPAPGEMLVNGTTLSTGADSSRPITPGRDSFRDRQRSIGELHQEIEAEHEGQVNRLLVMIREQQAQLQQLQAAQGLNNNSQSAIDDSPSVTGPASMAAPQVPRSPSYPRHPRSSFDLARADLQRRSRTPSRNASPLLGSTLVFAEGGDPPQLAARDESALYQAETQMLVRENQMLRHRIRELERQLSELNVNSSVSHEPATPSHLLTSQSVAEEETSKTDVSANH